MTPNPILKVLSTFKRHNVKSLLIGGQACIIYGAADIERLAVQLNQEEQGERQKDIEYWRPLRKELEELRRKGRKEIAA